MRLLLLGSGSYKSALNFRLAYLGTQLGKQGHDVTMVVPSADKYNDFTPDPRPVLSHVTVLQPWQLKTHSTMLNLIPYLFTSLAAILKAHPAVVYLYKPTPATILGLLPKLLFRTPVLLDLDDLGSEVMKVQGQPGLQVKLVGLCERLATRYADSVVVTSTYLRDRVAARYPGKDILVLSNGVEPEDYPKVTVQKPRQHIYYVGVLNRLALVEDLLRALPEVRKAVPGVTVSILGDGSDLPAAKKLAKKLGIETAIHFNGWTNRADAPKFSQYGDLAICYQPDTPTVNAASNMKVFEYMAMGMVPVVSDVGDLKMYVGNGTAGVAVKPGDPHALASRLITLLQDDAQRSKLAAAALRRAHGDYSWQQLAATLGQHLQTMLQSRATSQSK